MSYIGQGLEYGRQEKYVFTATGGETSVTTSDDSRSVSYSIGYVDVYLNGVRLISGSDYTATSGTSITGLSALTSGDVVEVVAHNVSSIIDAVSPTTGGTFNSNVTFAGNTNFSDTAFFADNVKLKFGDGEDLQIYHDGSHSYINDVGTGSIIVYADDSFNVKRGANYSALFDTNAEVALYYNGASKFTTTSSGVSVTGRASGTQTTDNDGSFDLTASNHFVCTPTANFTLTFTNHTAGQSGSIILDNSSGYTVSAAATTKVMGADLLTTISTAGVYVLGYISDGTNTRIYNSGAQQ